MSQKLGFDPDGLVIGTSSTPISLYGKTPIAQQTAPTAVTTTVPQPGATQSQYLLSLQSNVDNTLTLGNAIRQDLIDFGIYV